MLTVCWSPKGGSGTTVVACALALAEAAHQDTVLVDLAGDVPGALGLADQPGPGVSDWIASTTAEPPAVEALAIGAIDDLRVVPQGDATVADDSARWQQLGRFLAGRAGLTVVDGGSGGAPPPGALLDAATHRLLVIRPCYLALRRAARCSFAPTGVVLLREPGRALRADDVAWAVHAPVLAELALDPAVARAVDAGLLASRLPRSLTSELRKALA